MNSIIFQTEKKDGTFRTWRNVAIPVKYGQLLDEQLDYAVVSLIRVKRKVFKPLTRAKLTVISNTPFGGEQSKEIDYFIANDEYVENPVGSGIYNHELSLIELTKFLECFPVESLCFTNPRGSNYISGAVLPDIEITSTIEGEDTSTLIKDYVDSLYRTPCDIGKKYALLDVTVPASPYNEVSGTVTIEGGGETTIFDIPTDGILSNNVFNIAYGANKITYSVNIIHVPTGGIYATQTSIFTIYGGGKLPLAPWTEEQVTQRLLDLVEPLRKSDTPRFTLNTGNNAVFQNLAPEYTFTRMNLRECLQMQGGRIHGEPRLTINAQGQNEVSFDWYGGREYAKIINYKKSRRKLLNTYKYTTDKGNWDIEQASNRMESYMDNLVNRLDWERATLGQPMEAESGTAVGGQSLRTETYTQFNESDNVFFPSQYPIDRPVKLEVYLNTGSFDTSGFYDITDFLYESTVYNNLSGYTNDYPAKSFALYYTQGAKNIKGLFYKVPYAGGGNTVNYSIVNIIQAVTGVVIPTDSYPNITMRLTYVPIYSTRVAHGKQYLTDYLPLPRTLNYAQGANSVETRFFGQNIKSTVQRLGNIERYCTFILRNVNNIPTAGQLWDDENYISAVNVSVGKYLIHCTVGLSKHFNRKSQYIGANSYKRIYEVSEKQVQQRHSLYGDYIVIGDKKTVDISNPLPIGKPLLSADGFNIAVNGIFDSTYTITGSLENAEISAAEIVTTSKNGNLNPAIILPTISSAFGNAMEFSWEFKDNFSAGDVSVKEGAWTFSEGAEYGDYYGRAYYLYFALRGKERQLDAGGYTADGFPKLDNPPTLQKYCGVPYAQDSDPIVLRKDSREALRMSYIAEYVAENGDYIIGEALPLSCPLVAYENRKPNLYILNRQVGVFDDKILPSDIVANLGETTVTEYRGGNNTTQTLQGGTATAEGLSWCYAFPIVQGEGTQVEDEDGNVTTIYTKTGGEILLAKNVSISVGDTVGECDFTLVHDIYAYKKARNI